LLLLLGREEEEADEEGFLTSSPASSSSSRSSSTSTPSSFPPPPSCSIPNKASISCRLFCRTSPPSLPPSLPLSLPLITGLGLLLHWPYSTPAKDNKNSDSHPPSSLVPSLPPLPSPSAASSFLLPSLPPSLPFRGGEEEERTRTSTPFTTIDTPWTYHKGSPSLPPPRSYTFSSPSSSSLEFLPLVPPHHQGSSPAA